MRIIRGLEWARLTADPPQRLSGKQPRLRGAKARGKTFERRFQRWLTRLLTGTDIVVRCSQWIVYFDSEGTHWMQPDVYVEFPDKIVLLECKLTQTNEALAQCLEYYKPVLEMIHGKPVVSCQVVNNLRWDVGRLEVSGWDDLLGRDVGPVYLWHFLGG